MKDEQCRSCEDVTEVLQYVVGRLIVKRLNCYCDLKLV